jgi:hypothetical protein
MATISAVMLHVTKGHTILPRNAPLVREIVVVDMDSSDKTAEIARNLRTGIFS